MTTLAAAFPFRRTTAGGGQTRTRRPVSLLRLLSAFLVPYLILTTVLNVRHTTTTTNPAARDAIAASPLAIIGGGGVRGDDRVPPRLVGKNPRPPLRYQEWERLRGEGGKGGSGGGKSSDSAPPIAIREYVRRHSGRVLRQYLSILTWDGDGEPNLDRLRRQCDFRNGTQSATWPFLLLDCCRGGGGRGDGGGGGVERNRIMATVARPPPSPHGTIALLPTTDYARHADLNWTVPAPVPVLAYTVPISASRLPWVRLIPTPYEMSMGAVRAVESVRPHLRPFMERIPVVIYRGLILMNPDVRGRAVDLARQGNNSDWLDATPVRLGKEEMVKHRYLLDIGGISGTTWIALRWKMCSGSLVFKVDDPEPTMDWWHDRIRPWNHYIPVKYDLTDLRAGYEWAESHPAEAEAIAEAGRRVCEATLSAESLTEAVQDVVGSLPPAEREQMDEVARMFESSEARLERGDPPLLFAHGRQTNLGRRFECP